MDLTNSSAVVTGGASGLGLATVRGARGSRRRRDDRRPAASRPARTWRHGSATSSPSGRRTFATPLPSTRRSTSPSARAPLRTLVHCAGRGGTVRLVNRDGTPGDYDLYREIVDINLVGTFNVLRLAATRMSAQRAGRRRARRLRAHRVGRCVGGPDRPDPLRVGQGRHRRHDAGGGARPLASADPGVLDRARSLRHADPQPVLGRDQAGAGRPGAAPRSSRPAGGVRLDWRCTSSTTRCSTARRSGSTGRSGWRRGERSGQHPRRVGRPGRHHQAPRGAQRDQHGDRRGDRGGHGPLDSETATGRRGDHRRRAGRSAPGWTSRRSSRASGRRSPAAASPGSSSGRRRSRSSRRSRGMRWPAGSRSRSPATWSSRAENARFGLPEVKRGLVAAGGGLMRLLPEGPAGHRPGVGPDRRPRRRADAHTRSGWSTG